MIVIKPIETDPEYDEFQDVVRHVWGAEDIDVPPKHLLISARAHGGLVLGAYDEHERMVGILFGIPAFKDGKVYHYSHMCGVLSELRYQGVGYQLKLRQREYVLNQNLDLVIWTYDPLEAANGHFNLSKLGAISRTYKRNFYGVMKDSLNVGLESDRLLVEWWVRSKRVTDRLEGRTKAPTLAKLVDGGAMLINGTEVTGGLVKPVSYSLQHDQERLLVEVPENNQMIKSKSPDLAREWRMVTREIFEEYFRKGFIATEVIREIVDGLPRSFYVLEKQYG